MALILQRNSEVPPARHNIAPDYRVTHGSLKVGRIYKRESAMLSGTQWLWAISGVYGGPDTMRRSGMTETLDQAEATLKENWDQWMAWADLSEAGKAADLSEAGKAIEEDEASFEETWLTWIKRGSLQDDPDAEPSARVMHGPLAD